jgi:hypothetical protein
VCDLSALADEGGGELSSLPKGYRLGIMDDLNDLYEPPFPRHSATPKSLFLAFVAVYRRRGMQ